MSALTPIIKPQVPVSNILGITTKACTAKDRAAAKDRITKLRQASSIRALERRAYLAKIQRQVLTQGVSGKVDISDPWKAKREKEKMESRKRKIEREGRKNRFEEMRGREWMVEEAERVLGGLAV